MRGDGAAKAKTDAWLSDSKTVAPPDALVLMSFLVPPKPVRRVLEADGIRISLYGSIESLRESP